MSADTSTGVVGVVKRLLGIRTEAQQGADVVSSSDGLSTASTPPAKRAVAFVGPVEIEELAAALLPDFYVEDLNDVIGEDGVQCDALQEEVVEDDARVRRERKRIKLRLGVRVKRGQVEEEEEVVVEVPQVPLASVVDIGLTLSHIHAFDSALQKAAGDADLTQQSSGVLAVCDIPKVAEETQAELVKVFDHMMATFERPCFRERYGQTRGDRRERKLHFGGSVPSYFANVVEQSIHRRKVLSMAGMRNLIGEGRRIYEELAATKFASDPEMYCGNVGVNRMREVTGNTVDLDTCVLRPSDRATMVAINAVNAKAGVPTWECHSEFSSSEQAYDIADQAARTLTEQFIKDMKMTEAEAKERRIHSSQFERPVPMATHNTHRGKWPVWHYVNVGIDSFHANVPNMHDVNGALLRSPMHCVQGYLHVHQLAASKPTQEEQEAALDTYLDRFFEDAVADSCFNMKWKALEEFNMQLAHERTLVHLIEVTQADHQTVFSAIMDRDDADATEERAELFRLLDGKQAYSVVDKAVRSITRQDIDAWAADASVVL